MAFNNNQILMFNIALIFLLSAISGESHLPTPSQNDVPHEERALTDRYLMTHMEMASSKIEQFLEKVILKRLDDDPFTEESARECLWTCKDAYEDAMKAMQKGYADVSVENYYKADVDVNAFSTDIRICEGCFVQMIGKDIEVEKFQEWAKGIANDCHTKLEKYTHSVYR